MRSFKSPSLAAAVTCCLVAIASCGGGGPQPVTGLAGTVLEQPPQAVDFTLTDQHGSTFRMAGTRGNVVLMSFLPTLGGDSGAATVKEVYDLLGAYAHGVVFVSVTLDPTRDTPDVLADFSKRFGLFDVWHFVCGPAQDVNDVLFAYGVAVSADPETPFGSYDREYYAPLCLIDKRGYVRALMDSDVAAAEIARSIRVLLAFK